MAINGAVFNVTAYMDFHPGGWDELAKVTEINTSSKKRYNRPIDRYGPLPCKNNGCSKYVRKMLIIEKLHI